MLGSVVARYLGSAGHAVRTSETRFSPDDGLLLREIATAQAEVVVNCAAVLPAKASSPTEMFLVNSLLPQLLAAQLAPSQMLVHASTDGVFTGDNGPYAADARPDAQDAYGLSKRLGELAGPGRILCIRSSIVDAEGGLLAWLRLQQGQVDGYTNHMWNGVTALEWARACGELMASPPSSPIAHLTCSEPVSKYELLQAAAAAFAWPARVEPVCAPTALNRALVPTHRRAPIRELLLQTARSCELLR